MIKVIPQMRNSLALIIVRIMHEDTQVYGELEKLNLSTLKEEKKFIL